MAVQNTVVCDVGSGYMKTGAFLGNILIEARAGRTRCDESSTAVLALAGFAGDTFPRAIFPCVVGRAAGAAAEAAFESEGRGFVVGAECLAAEGRSRVAQAALALTHPISNGVVRCWEDMSLVFQHTFRDVLCVDPRDCQARRSAAAPRPPLLAACMSGGGRQAAVASCRLRLSGPPAQLRAIAQAGGAPPPPHTRAHARPTSAALLHPPHLYNLPSRPRRSC